MSEVEQEQPQPAVAPAEEEEAAEEEESQPEGAPAEVPEQPTPEEPPEEPQGATPEEWEQRFKKAEKAFASYSRRVGDLWGDDATDLVPVVLSPSAPPGFIYTHDAGRVPDEVKEPILAFFGMPVEPDYEYDPTKPACTTCKGKGKIRTGSEVPNYRTLSCETCNGRGYTMPSGEAVNGPTELTAVPVAVGAEESPALQEDADVWGHPRLLPDGMDNPNFGRSPQYLDPRYP